MVGVGPSQRCKCILIDSHLCVLCECACQLVVSPEHMGLGYPGHRVSFQPAVWVLMMPPCRLLWRVRHISSSSLHSVACQVPWWSVPAAPCNGGCVALLCPARDAVRAGCGWFVVADYLHTLLGVPSRPGSADDCWFCKLKVVCCSCQTCQTDALCECVHEALTNNCV